MWDDYHRNSVPDGHPGGRWRADIAEALGWLRQDTKLGSSTNDFSNDPSLLPPLWERPVRMVCEIQFTLGQGVRVRHLMHEPYKLVRAPTALFLHEDCKRAGKVDVERKMIDQVKRKEMSELERMCCLKQQLEGEKNEVVDYQAMEGFVRDDIHSLTMKNSFEIACLVGERVDFLGLSEMIALASSRGGGDGSGGESGETHGWRMARNMVSETLDPSIPVLRALISHGVQVNHQMANDETLLFAACLHGHANVVHLLLELGADLSVGCSFNKLDDGFDAPTPLRIACQNDHADVVEILLRHERSDSHHQQMTSDELGVALFVACQSGFPDVARMLLAEKNCDPNWRRKGTVLDTTCVFVASFCGHQDVLELLLEAGASWSEVVKCDDDATPFHGALRNEHVACAQVLLAAATAEVTTAVPTASDGGTSSKKEPVEAPVHALLEARTTEESGWMTPLLKSVRFDRLESVRWLLQCTKADVNAIAGSACAGFSSLHLAVNNGSASMLEILLSAKAAVIDVNVRRGAEAPDGITPLHLSVQNRRSDLASRLLRAGADVNIRGRLDTGQTVLMKAIETEMGEEFVRMLVEDWGADVNVVRGDGATALALAEQRGEESVASILRKWMAAGGGGVEEEVEALGVEDVFVQVESADVK